MEKYSQIISQINNAIEKFNLALGQKEHHVPLLSEKELSNKSFFFNLTNTSFWAEKWPNSDHKGVYFLFGVNEKNNSDICLYVGKASFGSAIGIRLNYHLRKHADSEGPYYWNENSGNPYIVELVSSISLENKLVDMTSSLEEFLIKELKQNGVHLLNSIGN